jgi:hypothetical protein
MVVRKHTHGPKDGNKRARKRDLFGNAMDGKALKGGERGRKIHLILIRVGHKLQYRAAKLVGCLFVRFFPSFASPA